MKVTFVILMMISFLQGEKLHSSYWAWSKGFSVQVQKEPIERIVIKFSR